MFFAFMVYEACFSDGADGIGEDGCVVGDERFKVARCWCWTSTAGIEVLWNHLLHQTGVVIELFAHLAVSVVAC
jgi:hypothetical protein